MIQFKDIKREDKDVIESFTYWNERQNCDFSIANIISWRFLYGTQYAVVDNHIVFRFYTDKHLAYMFPIPRPKKNVDGTFEPEKCDECMAKVVRTLRADSIAMGHPFLMLGVGKFAVDFFTRMCPDSFAVKPDRNYYDYIYTRDKLINLSGKKLQNKRNHINKFKSLYPNYEYRVLTPELIPECLRLEEQWRRVSKEFKGKDDADESLSEEYYSMTRAFDFWEELNLVGGTIFVENKLVAFTFGCPINHNTFDVCVEKADIAYEGAFTIINQEFVKHLPEQFIFINREEDMGNETLRYAKMSYHPDILLEKYVVIEKHPLKPFEDWERIKQETRNLWKLVFEDSEEFMNLYFERVYKPEYNVCCQIDGHVVGAMQTLPYNLLCHGMEIKTAYISGVSTHPDFRGQGVGNNLMRQAHFELYYKGVVLSVLIPAEQWLYKWYGECGYAQVICCTPPPMGIETMSFETFDAFQRQKTCVLLHSAEDYDIVQEDIRLAGKDYEPTDEDYPAMLRVLNVRAALEFYMRQNPRTEMTLKLHGDSYIPSNNAYYVMSNGQVKQTSEPHKDAVLMTPVELAEWFFKNERPELFLMLE